MIQYWQELVWKVLFPLLEQVKTYLSTASKERDAQLNNTSFLMHHSRDTAEKQWAETSVLTLAGVARVFNSKCSTLIQLNDFHKMWLLLLEYIESSSLSTNNEISLSSLRSFHELLGNQNIHTSSSVNSQAAAVNSQEKNEQQQRRASDSASSLANAASPVSKYLDISQWLAAWKIWLNIGMNINYTKETNNADSTTTDTTPAPAGKVNASNKKTNSRVESSSSNTSIMPPNQIYLTCYIDLIPIIIDLISFKFTRKDFELYSTILDKLLSIPVLGSDYASFVFSQTDANLTPLQNACLNSVKHFIKVFTSIHL